MDVTLVVPSEWPASSPQPSPIVDSFPVVELDVRRPGDINRHAYADLSAVRRLISELRPDLLDVQAEPFSVAARQWLQAAPVGLATVMYSAQNVDKRFPPPYCAYERAAFRRVAVFYPCSQQAASVLRGKGFRGKIDVLPLGYDDAVFVPGAQSPAADEIELVFAGRLVHEKGVLDAVRILALVNADRPARLVIVGEGPELRPAQRLAAAMNLTDRLRVLGWQSGERLAQIYRSAHIVLVPSRPTNTWVEQFGRVIVEAQASGSVVAGYASGAIPEVAGEAALLAPVGQFDELARDIVRVLRSPHEFSRRRSLGQSLSTTRTWRRVASRQTITYQAALTGNQLVPGLPKSPAKRRVIARAEFGETASTLSGNRPFALPVLRAGGRFSNLLAASIDAGAEIAARLRR